MIKYLTEVEKLFVTHIGVGVLFSRTTDGSGTISGIFYKKGLDLFITTAEISFSRDLRMSV